MDPYLVILAGGISSRMKKQLSATSDVEPELIREAQQKPKSMITLGNNQLPLMDYLLYNAREAGYCEAVIVVSERDSVTRQYYGAPETTEGKWGVKISYAVQTIPAGRSKPLGTADALLRALVARQDWQGKKFTVCNSDNLYSQKSLRILLQSHHRCAMIDYDWDALGFEQTRIEQFSVIQKNPQGFLVDIIEKPSREQMQTATDIHGRVSVSMNIFRFSYDLIFPFLETAPLHPVRDEKELPQVVKMMASLDPHLIATIPLAEIVPDLTSQSDISRVREYLRREYAAVSLERR